MAKLARPPRSDDADERADWYEEVERQLNTLIASTSAYTVTNGTTDRTYDADATSTAELADVLGTLIADLKTKGILS